MVNVQDHVEEERKEEFAVVINQHHKTGEDIVWAMSSRMYFVTHSGVVQVISELVQLSLLLLF